jgi:hypothetical protein
VHECARRHGQRLDDAPLSRIDQQGAQALARVGAAGIEEAAFRRCDGQPRPFPAILVEQRP